MYICIFCFRLHKFPSTIKRSLAHAKWQQLINRSSPGHPGKMMKVRPKQRVCSIHFVEREPTHENPYPTLNLGYHASPRVKKFLSTGSRRKLKYSLLQPEKKRKNTPDVLPGSSNDPTMSSTIIQISLEQSSMSDLNSPPINIMPDLDITLPSDFVSPDISLNPSEANKERELLLNSLTLLAILKIKFSIIGITETKFSKDVSPSINFSLPNYSVEHVPAESSAGGALLYIADYLSYKQRKDLTNNLYKSKELESIFIEIMYKKKKI